MNKQKLLNDVLAKHGGKCVREDGRNYWVKDDQKVLLTGGFLMGKMREEVVKKVGVTKTVTPKPVVTEVLKPIVVEQPVKKKAVVVKPQAPDVNP